MLQDFLDIVRRYIVQAEKDSHLDSLATAYRVDVSDSRWTLSTSPHSPLNPSLVISRGGVVIHDKIVARSQHIQQPIEIIDTDLNLLSCDLQEVRVKGANVGVVGRHSAAKKVLGGPMRVKMSSRGDKGSSLTIEKSQDG